MQQTEDVERKAFTVWLRTGRWPRQGARIVDERKFNPNHDPSNGQFTAGGGSFGGAGSMGSWSGAGGSAGGGDASGSRNDAARRTTAPPRGRAPMAPAAARPAATDGALPGQARAVEAPKLRQVMRNGYRYTIDDQGRTREVSGTLTLSPN